MVAPGRAFTAPRFEISVNGNPLKEDINRRILDVSYESVDGIADVGKITIANPGTVRASAGDTQDFQAGDLTDSTLFQVGNEISFKFGYGQLKHIGRVQIAAPRFNFPRDSIPTIEVIGYTKDHVMMDNEPKKGKQRIYQGTSFGIMFEVASRYGFASDVDEYNFGRKTIVQKAGMSDYDLCKSMANISGYAFWVDGDENGTWTLHFRKANDRGIIPDIQDRKFTLTYNDADSALFSFSPEFTLRGQQTGLKVLTRNPVDGKSFFAEFNEKEADTPEISSVGDAAEKVPGQLTTGGSAKLFFKDFSFTTITNKRFKSQAEAALWAQQWFRRNREKFLQGSGEALGIEEVFARHIHTLKGMGRVFDGDYQFSRVEHKFTMDAGYLMNFNARKVLPHGFSG